MFRYLKEEIVSAIPAIIFFVVAGNLIQFTEGLMLRPGDTQYFSYLTVTLGALVLGKFLIIVNTFSFINMFPNKPLIYNITWKVCLYGLLSILFRMLERFIEASISQDSFAVAYQMVCYKLSSPVFWSIQLWLVAILTIYSIGSEFARVMGRDKIRKMVWG